MLCVLNIKKRRKSCEKVLPIVALLGMMSFGVQEMNVRADTYHKGDSKISFGIRKERVLIS